MCKQSFPRIPWGPEQLGKVLAGTAALALTAAAVSPASLLGPPAQQPNLPQPHEQQQGPAAGLRAAHFAPLPQAPAPRAGSSTEATGPDATTTAATATATIDSTSTSTTSTSSSASEAASALAGAPGARLGRGAGASETRGPALAHVATEAALLLGTGGLLWGALGSTRPRAAGCFRYALPPGWALTTAVLCAGVFPFVDPVVAQGWAAALAGAGVGGGGAGGGALVAQLAACRDAGDGLSLALHGVASAVLGPVWEETFWRGFFLASLTRVLPLPACVAASSLGFAALHLSPANLVPILLLAVLGDALCLRSASLGPPILLHAAWNGYQVAAIALGGKDYWV